MTDSYVITQSGTVSVVEADSPITDVVLVEGPQGPPGPPGPAALLVQTIYGDGTTGEFQLDVPTTSINSVQVFRNGLAEIAGVGFTTSSDGGNTVVSFSTVPLANDEVQVVYQI